MNFDALADNYFEQRAAARAAADNATPTEHDADDALDFNDLQPVDGLDNVFAGPDGQAYLIDVDEAGEHVAWPVDLDADDDAVEPYTEIEAQVAQAFLDAADDPDQAYDAFMRWQAKMGDPAAQREVDILDEVVSEQLAEEITETEIQDWLDTQGVADEVGSEYILKAANLIEAGDVESDDVFEVAEQLLEDTRAAEAEAVRELRYTREAGVTDWRTGLDMAYSEWANGDTDRYRATEQQPKPVQRETGLGPTQRSTTDAIGAALDSVLEQQDAKARYTAAVRDRLRSTGEMT